MRRHPIAALLLLVAAIALTGCEFEFSTGDETVPADEVAEKAKASLNEIAAEEGFPPLEKVECPEDLKGEEGATIRCDAFAGGEDIEVLVEAVEVDGDEVKMEFEVVEIGEAGQES